MTAEFAITLAVTSALILLARFVLPQLPLGRVGVRVSGGDLVLLGVGIAGLTFHCTAMFYRQVFDAFPAAAPLVDAVNALGVASIVLYVVPALVLLTGFRHQHWLALTAMTLALIAVGLTMYLGSPLRVHLVTIFIAVVVLSGEFSLLVIGPWQKRDTGAVTPRP